jgi:Na+/H+-dicarboxylate symporter
MTKRNISRTLLRLFFFSLVVGLALSALNVSPQSLLGTIGGTMEIIFLRVADVVAWAVPFVLIGAVVVVPIWLILSVLRIVRRR